MRALWVIEVGLSFSSDAAAQGAMWTRSGVRIRELLVISEVALACALLVFGGLFMRSFQELLKVDLGYTPAQAVAWQLNPSRSFKSPEEESSFFEQIVTRVEAIQGVESVGLTDALPLGKNRSWGYKYWGYPKTTKG
ncbi:MAG: hypothetical protein O2992_03535 [Gemmatimonadetes bacterium]|jgi:putative ABC transport system permease protein|nr:hypothetical protein [Gemmatimonadota bacterium]